MVRCLQINLVLYCFLWHLIWLFSCPLYYFNDGNSRRVKIVPFTESINYQPIVALQSAGIKQTTISTSTSHPFTDCVLIATFFRVTEPNQLVAKLWCLKPCAAIAYNPPQLLPSRASPA